MGLIWYSSSHRETHHDDDALDEKTFNERDQAVRSIYLPVCPKLRRGNEALGNQAIFRRCVNCDDDLSATIISSPILEFSPNSTLSNEVHIITLEWESVKWIHGEKVEATTGLRHFWVTRGWSFVGWIKTTGVETRYIHNEQSLSLSENVR